jgi:hypothetical protein
MARRLVARFATFWIGSSSSSSIAKGSSSSLDSLERFLGPFVEFLDRVGRSGAGFSKSASLVAGVDLNDRSVVLTSTESTVLEGEERVFLRRGGIATARTETRGTVQATETPKPNTGQTTMGSTEVRCARQYRGAW